MLQIAYLTVNFYRSNTVLTFVLGLEIQKEMYVQAKKLIIEF